MAVTQKQITDLRTADAALGLRIDKEVAARVALGNALDARIDKLEADYVKLLLLAGGSGGGTVPDPNPPPGPTPDITAPVISGLVIDQITTTSARVSWTTDEASDTQLDYGIETTLGSQTALVATLVTSHVVTLTGLTPGLRYNVRARSRDAAGNLALSSSRQFSTLAVSQPPPGPVPPTGVVREAHNFSELRTYVDDPTVDTVMVHDGTYSIGYFLPPVARPSTRPLLVQAVNVPASPEDPHGVIFTGSGTAGRGMFFRNRRGTYTTWQGISFEGFSVADTGIVVFGAYGEPGPDHVSFLDTRMVGNTPLNAHNSHHFYLSDGSSHDILIDRYYVEGVSHAAFSGFHAYHNPLGTAVQVKNAEMRNLYAALLMYGNLTAFLGENIVIDDVHAATDIVGIQGTLRNVDATNVDPGYGQIKNTGSGGSGPMVVEATCSGLPAVTA